MYHSPLVRFRLGIEVVASGEEGNSRPKKERRYLNLCRLVSNQRTNNPWQLSCPLHWTPTRKGSWERSQISIVLETNIKWCSPWILVDLPTNKCHSASLVPWASTNGGLATFWPQIYAMTLNHILMILCCHSTWNTHLQLLRTNATSLRRLGK